MNHPLRPRLSRFGMNSFGKSKRDETIASPVYKRTPHREDPAHGGARSQLLGNREAVSRGFREYAEHGMLGWGQRWHIDWQRSLFSQRLLLVTK